MENTSNTVDALTLAEASAHALTAIRELLLRVAHAQNEKPSCPDWALREMLAIADTAHNLPSLSLEPEAFSPGALAACAKAYRKRYGAGAEPAIGYTYWFWNDIDRLIGSDLGDWIRAKDEEFQ